MNAEEVREIVEELRGHILDKAGSGRELTLSGVDAALGALGDPEALAAEYLTDYLMARAEVSRSPLRLLESLFRWASLSVAGFFVLMGALIGYFLGSCFMLCGFLKPFHPHTAGLWQVPSAPGETELSLRLGFGSAPPGGKELLGWWMLPLGLVGGGGLVMLTTMAALWFIRQYRKARPLPRDLRPQEGRAI
jgi:hypothetical protein